MFVESGQPQSQQYCLTMSAVWLLGGGAFTATETVESFDCGVHRVLL